jgi:hypothetical protein
MTINNSVEFDTETIARTIGRRDALQRAGILFTSSAAQSLLDAATKDGDSDLVDAVRARAEAYGWVLNDGTPGREAATAKTLLVQLMNLTVSSHSDVVAAEAFTNPRYSPDGLKEERTARTASAIATIAGQATSIVNRITTATASADARLQTLTPTLNLNDSNQVTRTTDVWTAVIAPILNSNAGATDAAIDWGKLLDSLDLDGLFAVQRFAPAWLRTRGSAFGTDDIVDTVLDGVESRIPKAASPDVRNALADSERCHDILDSATALAEGLGAVTNSTQAFALQGMVQRASVYAGVADQIVWPATEYRRLF